MISLIWVMTDQWVIGHNNKIPWYIKEDIQIFKEYTMGKTIVMGRKTFESIGSKPLPNRKNIVVTRDNDFANNSKNKNITVINDYDKFLKENENSNEEIVVIGGSKIYEEALKYAKKLVVSIVKMQVKGDVYFPKINFDDYKLVKKEAYNEFNLLIYIKE